MTASRPREGQQGPRLHRKKREGMGVRGHRGSGFDGQVVKVLRKCPEAGILETDITLDETWAPVEGLIAQGTLKRGTTKQAGWVEVVRF